jgi:hypothetical protein
MKFDWKQWANVLLGLLVIIFAFTGGHVLRFVIVGAIIVILAVWAALERKKS